MANDRQLIVKILGDSRSVEKAFKKASHAGNSFGSKMKRLSKGAALGIAGVATAAAGLSIAIGIQAVKAASSFETSMSRIIGLAGQSRAQVERWSSQLLSLGPSLGKSPQELADALYFIASSGIPASKAISALTASAKASSAGLGETQVVADAVTSVMNAYASSGMTAARATDVLVATVREGKGEADQFAGTIGNVAAFASRLKVPFEQVGAALAAMTQLGTDPRTAATQLSAFFSGVLKVSAPLQKRADKIGFSFEQLTRTLASGDLRGALQYIKDFAVSHGGIQSLALMFPNIRALRALLALTAEDGGKVVGVFRRMANSSGSMGVAFGAAAKTSQHSFDVFHASIQALKIAFGQGLLPVVNKVALKLGKKFADPKFVLAVQRAGKRLGDAFMRLGIWFEKNWPTIMADLHKFVRVVGKVVSAMQWLDEHKGPSGKDIIGKITGAPGALGHKLGGLRVSPSGGDAPWTPPRTRVPRKFTGGGARTRAHGGSVYPGGSYTIGEHGPETVSFGRSGYITPNGGGGGGGDLVLMVDGRELGRVALSAIQRHGKNFTGQTRGRHGGHKLALG